MAIGLGDLEEKQTEYVNKLRESDEIKILEEAIDSAIVREYKKTTKGWFRKVALIKAQFSAVSLGIGAKETVWRLYQHENDTFEWLLMKYRALGWKVEFEAGAGKEFRFSRKADEPAKENGVLAEKTQRIAELKTEIAQLEAEIQFLTESPNGRDPLLLPETAGK